MTELSTVYGPSCVTYATVRPWKKKYDSGLECTRPKSTSCKENISKIKEIIEKGARFTVSDIARMVGISLA